MFHGKAGWIRTQHGLNRMQTSPLYVAEETERVEVPPKKMSGGAGTGLRP